MKSASTSDARGLLGERSAATIRITAGWFDVFTYSMFVAASNAPDPQLAPPITPGRTNVPCSDGGVYSGPRRYFFSCSCACAFNSGVRSNASSTVIPCGEIGGGLGGEGVGGDAPSPGPSLAGTGRAAYSPTGLP